jgi:hypothetical protein
VAASKGQQQPECSCGKVIPPEFGADPVCHMTAVQTHVLGVTDPEVDFSRSAPRFRTQYVENVIRNPVLRGVRGLSRHQTQSYVIVTDLTGFEKPKRPGLIVHMLIRHPKRGRGSGRYDATAGRQLFCELCLDVEEQRISVKAQVVEFHPLV